MLYFDLLWYKILLGFISLNSVSLRYQFFPQNTWSFYSSADLDAFTFLMNIIIYEKIQLVIILILLLKLLLVGVRVKINLSIVLNSLVSLLCYILALLLTLVWANWVRWSDSLDCRGPLADWRAMLWGHRVLLWIHKVTPFKPFVYLDLPFWIQLLVNSLSARLRLETADNRWLWCDLWTYFLTTLPRLMVSPEII